MTRLTDDINHYFKVNNINLMTATDAVIAEHWPAIEQDASVQGHAAIRGSVAAALACELVHAEQEIAELKAAAQKRAGAVWIQSLKRGLRETT
jgi:beta-glucosidase/6-phospho-beta-glucosidase/beta-galactosidase